MQRGLAAAQGALACLRGLDHNRRAMAEDHCHACSRAVDAAASLTGIYAGNAANKLADIKTVLEARFPETQWVVGRPQRLDDGAVAVNVTAWKELRLGKGSKMADGEVIEKGRELLWSFIGNGGPNDIDAEGITGGFTLVLGEE